MIRKITSAETDAGDNKMLEINKMLDKINRTMEIIQNTMNERSLIQEHAKTSLENLEIEKLGSDSIHSIIIQILSNLKPIYESIALEKKIIIRYKMFHPGHGV